MKKKAQNPARGSEYEQVILTLDEVTVQHHSLTGSSDSPLARQISYGVLRHWFSLNRILDVLVTKPLPDKHTDLRLLILAGLYSVTHLNRPAHASVNAVVNTAAAIGKPWARGLVNGVLRNYLRRTEKLHADANKYTEAQYEQPDWFIQRITTAWPEHAESIFAALAEQPPMTLRINLARTTRAEYLDTLAATGLSARPGDLVRTSVILDSAVSVSRLPGFTEGLVSIQDEASQIAATLLAPDAAHRVLDLCAAPGGKTCHLLESSPGIALVANDKSEERLSLVRDNLERLSLSCTLTTRDAATPSEARYDRVLLDAPCSATGIIRRHPDIKLLRREEDIAKLAATQERLINEAWQQVVEGGELLYSTCSVLPEENETVARSFLDRNPDATAIPVPRPVPSADTATPFTQAVSQEVGLQILPGPRGCDGFYYAHFRKGLGPAGARS